MSTHLSWVDDRDMACSDCGEAQCECEERTRAMIRYDGRAAICFSIDDTIHLPEGGARAGIKEDDAVSVVRTADLDQLLQVRTLAVLQGAADLVSCTYARIARAVSNAPVGALGAITTAEGIREFVERYAPAEEGDR